MGSVKKLLSEDHQLSAVKLAEKIGVASRNIENNIKKLKEYGILIRHGSPKNGYWEIVDKYLYFIGPYFIGSNHDILY